MDDGAGIRDRCNLDLRKQYHHHDHHVRKLTEVLRFQSEHSYLMIPIHLTSQILSCHWKLIRFHHARIVLRNCFSINLRGCK